jgi:DNA-binding transcriptional regulator YiaG
VTDLRVSTIENVAVADTPAAVKIAEIARARSGERLGDVLQEIGAAVGVRDWTVYNWLRGTHNPSPARLGLLLRL